MNERQTEPPRSSAQKPARASRPVGVVLAGGRSSRLGIDKARLIPGRQSAQVSEVGAGKSLLLLAIERMLAVCPEVLVADRQRHQELFAHLRQRVTSIADGPGRGPVAGILGASRRRPGVALLVLGCDLPSVPVALLENLIKLSLEPITSRQGHEPVMPQWTVARTRGGLEPLCAVYSIAALARLEERVENERFALYPLASELEVTVEVEAEQSSLFNLNTLSDLERFELDQGLRAQEEGEA